MADILQNPNQQQVFDSIVSGEINQLIREFNSAEDMNNNKYRLVGRERNSFGFFKNNTIPQLLSVTSHDFNEGQKWFMKDADKSSNFYSISMPYKIKQVTGNESEKTIIFKKSIKDIEKNKVDVESDSYKKTLENLKLSKPIIKENLLPKILLHVFPEQILNELLNADRIEFICDDIWFYLKCNNKAYRI